MRLDLLIQPFGAVLATDSNLEQITHVSQNLGRILGLSSTEWENRQVLGQTLSSLLPHLLIHDLCNACSLSSITGQREEVGVHEVGIHAVVSNPLDIRVSYRHGKTIIEFEHPRKSQERPGGLITQLKLLFHQAHQSQTLLSQAAQALQNITEFERVTVYRLCANGESQVIAEALPATVSTTLGIHYPATAIPLSTQTSLLQSFLRPVGHLHTPLIPILAWDQTEAPLDLSLSHLRGYVQPFQEYPQAPDTEASLAIAIPIHNQLWGMFVLEHPFPKVLSLNFRDRIELFGQLLALRLQQLLEQEQALQPTQIPVQTPVQTAAQNQGNENTTAQRPAQRKEAVLVLEDNMMLTFELENTLKQLGFQSIKSAPSVHRAARLLEQQTFQLALLDINLKGEKSFAIANTLLETGIPFAFTSGYDSNYNRPPSLQSIPLLKKPIELEKLKQTLEQLLHPQ